MITVEDLTPGQKLPAPIQVTVTEVTWNPQSSRRAEVALVDSEGNPLTLVDFRGASLSIDWKAGRRYRIVDCRVQTGSSLGDYILEATGQTSIKQLTGGDSRFLVIGDTHIGRKTHPKTGRDIDPLSAFQIAVEEAITQEVDGIIHVGDIFHDSATPVVAHFAKEQIFESLEAAEIPFYYVRGNHRSDAGDEVLEELSRSTGIHLDAEGVSVGGRVRIAGIDHAPNGEIPWGKIQFPSVIEEQVTIVVLHQSIETLSGPTPKSVRLETLSREFPTELDAVVCGHHHDAMRRTVGGIEVLYTGAAERMSNNANPRDRLAWFLHVHDEEVYLEDFEIPLR